MIRVTDKSKCTGCTACVTSCPVQCIVMRRDRQGFDYPVANPDICIGCGKCESVCPVINPSDPKQPLSSFAAKLPEHVDGSSSGGVFPYIAGKVIDEGGVVFGAVLNDDMTVGHAEAETVDEMEMMRGSKYVQSDLYSTFDDVKAYLDQGRKVMFAGTPCQIAGLKSYLGREHDGLLAIDVACHGVPSPGLWSRYVEALGRKYHGNITSVTFRDKTRSWMHYDFVVANASGKYAVPYMNDPYMALFVQNMTLRPSCYECPVRSGRSGSDITLADMWKVGSLAKELDDDRGTSLVAVNTEKGEVAVKGLDRHEVRFDVASEGNGGFSAHAAIPQRRDEFFQGYLSAKDIISYMKGFVVRRPLHISIYRNVRRVLSSIKRSIKG